MGKTVAETVKRNLCTGCCACENICPVNAIAMQEDREGFIFPVVDTEKCINCGKCTQKCPVLSPRYKNTDNPECRAIWAKDEIRMKAASGGVFTAFAEVLIKRGGVACGAAYNDDLTVSHKFAEDLSGLEALKSSKYVQSNAGMSYRQVENYLKEGREVLFGGCPCQVAGLYAYLGNKKYDNLYTMDLICHGVPSPKVLRIYLNSHFKDKHINYIDFRAKEYYGWSTEMTITFDDGTIYRDTHDKDTFYRAFLPCMSLRKSCSSCPFSRLPRQGDLSIGDFWGIARYKKALNDKKGTSLVLVNNSKGYKILNECQELWTVNEVVPIAEGLRINKTIEHPFKPHPARKRFFDGLGKYDFDKLVDDCLKHHYDVGIVGLWYGLNYGSVLTYFALNRVLTDLGNQCLMINKPAKLWDKRFEDRNTIANKFIYRYCNVANIRRDDKDLKELNDHCDTFVLGSDVVWNYGICGKQAGHFFFLDFVDDSKKKIAYAASFGSGVSDNADYERRSRQLLKRFDAISVREKNAVDILSKNYGVDSQQVLDPVFLCDIKHYEAVIATSKLQAKSDFLSTYFLGPGPRKKKAILQLCKKMNLEYRNLYNPNIDISLLEQRLGLNLLRDVSVEDWLYYMSNCKFYIGDSFHGLCFALIFHKPFIVMIDKDLPSRNRFDTLLSIVGLQDRMVYLDVTEEELNRIAQTPIDYARVDNLLKPVKERSLEWLKGALTKPHVIHNHEYVTLDQFETVLRQLAKQDNEIAVLRKRLQYLCQGKDIIQFTDTIDSYTQSLRNNSRHCIYLIAVKDTPGLSVTEEMAARLRDALGIKTDMAQKHWKSYIAIVDAGKVVYEQLADKKLEKEVKVGEFNIKITSAALNVGNVAKIQVNGIEYAMNKRGFNIVAIDKEEGRVCDSAYLDMHLRTYAFGHSENI